MRKVDYRLSMMIGCAVCVASVFSHSSSATEVVVEPSVAVGIVKPVNGVGQPPMIGAMGNWDLMHYLQEAGIPYSRLHDVGGWLAGGLYVDIPNLFPRFEADENDPANYRFAYTDSLIDALVKNGVEPFFRLGVTIENFVERGYPPVNINPPADPAKWARVCEHVILHYTKGWANGCNYRITHWEIWNEPDNNPDIKRNPMFTGTFEEYMNLYGVTAKHLKAKFPDLKFGGYGSCGFYAGVGSEPASAANSSPRTEYFVECAEKFLAAARKNGWPLDFFSFHSYSDPREAARQVRFADELLNKHGFTRSSCERIFNEWLPHAWKGALGTSQQASSVAAELIDLQNGPCDVACIYDARCSVGSYSPLFNPMTYKPHKAYYAFTAFNELRKLKTAVKCEAKEGLRACAASADGKVAVMIANDGDKAVPLTLGVAGRKVVDCRVTDDAHTDEKVALPSEMPPRSFAVIVLE